MTKDEALKMAIEYFEAKIKGMNIINSNEDILNACKEALKQPAQEPVAWMHRHEGEVIEFNDFKSCKKCEPLYTHTAQPLSDDEIRIMDFDVSTSKENLSADEYILMFAREIEKHHGIK